MAEIRISGYYCKGCGLCIDACPSQCLRISSSLNDTGVQVAEVVDGGICRGCLQCHAVCPDAAIEILVAARKSQKAAASAGSVGGGQKKSEGAAGDR